MSESNLRCVLVVSFDFSTIFGLGILSEVLCDGSGDGGFSGFLKRGKWMGRWR